MSWIQENKLASALMGGAVVVSGVLFYLGYSARSEAVEMRIANNNKIAQANLMKEKEPYPNKLNKEMVDLKLEDFTKQSLEFQKRLIEFRPAEMPKLAPGDYATRVSQHIKKLTAYYKAKKVALPAKGASFGVEAYSGGRLAEKNSTRLLEYQRKALEWLFITLADSQPDSLDNVFRFQIKEETKPVVVAPTRASARNRNRNKKSTKLTSVYRALPIEVTFTGSEASLKSFMKELSNTKEYFYKTQSVRIVNSDKKSPDKSSGEFQVAPPVVDDFGGESFASIDDSAGQPIIKQVLGTERITAHLKLDLVLFNEANEVRFPGVKKPKPVKKAPAKSAKGSKPATAPKPAKTAN